jgi:Domain of unknown function (DUF4259)
MGAWEVGNFGNDDASDWVDELEESSGTKLLIQAFESIEKSDYADSPDCCIALATAETIAIANGHPSEDVLQSLRDWVKRQTADSFKALAPRAAAAVRKLQNKSELRDLWEESDSWQAWQQVVEGLLRRLNA